MVWIYGGGFYNGDVSGYLGYNLVGKAVSLGKPIVYVSLNYRLGLFGFPPGQAAADAGALNLGLKDQRLALEWVQQNIAYFGGDPTKVTIFGESAGAISVGYQTMYKGGDISGVFQGAIMQSGSPSSRNVPVPSDPVREAAYQFIVNATGCADSSNSFECVRGAPITALSQANQDVLLLPAELRSQDQGPVTFGPARAAGDPFFPTTPAEIIHGGKFAKVPFINGVQLDEGTLFAANASTTQEVVNFSMSRRPGLTFGFTNLTAVEQLLTYYPEDPAAGSPYGTDGELFGRPQQYKRLASLIGDILFQAPHRDHLRTATQLGVNAWSFTFAQFLPTTLGPWFGAQYGVRHTGEILFVFQALPTTTTPEMTELANSVTNYWTSFAYNLDPNPTTGSRNEVHWPKYGTDATSLWLQGGNVTAISDTYRQAGIDFIISNPSLYN